jgi:hypothetical protein
LGESLPHGAAVTFASFSSNGSQLVTAAADGKVRRWDTRTRQTVGQPWQHDHVSIANFSLDGNWIVTASTDGVARLWDARTGQAAGKIMHHGDKITCAIFNSDGEWILTACKDGMARVWNARNGQLLRELPHNGGVESVAIRRFPEGTRILTASDDHCALVWDAQTGARVSRPMQHDGWVYDAEFSPDGRWVVTASADGTARVWDARTGQPVSEPMRHDNAVIAASFSPDSRWIITASWDHSARVWDVFTGQPVSEPMRHGDRLTSARFSPNGQWLLTASLDGTARLWESVLTTKQAPDWLIALIEDAGGLRLDTERNLVLMTEDVADFRKNFSRLPDTDELARFGRWLVADPAARAVSPFSPLTVPEFVAQQLQAGDVESVQAAYRADPGNPVVLATLAKFSPDRTTAEFYCRLALQHARAETAPVQTAQVLAIGHTLFPDRAEFNAPAIVIP